MEISFIDPTKELVSRMEKGMHLRGHETYEDALRDIKVLLPDIAPNRTLSEIEPQPFDRSMYASLDELLYEGSLRKEDHELVVKLIKHALRVPSTIIRDDEYIKLWEIVNEMGVLV